MKTAIRLVSSGPETRPIFKIGSVRKNYVLKRLVSCSITQQCETKAYKICYKQKAGQSRAVVLGGSVSGVLAAKVIAPFFDQVVLVEKDPVFTDQAELTYLEDGVMINTEAVEVGDSYWFQKHRKGTPQREQAHVLLQKGQQIIEQNFPNFGNAVTQEGGFFMDFATDIVWSLNSRPFDMQIEPNKYVTIQANRICIDVALYKILINTCQNVIVLDRTAAKGLLVTGKDVKGVQLQFNNNTNDQNQGHDSNFQQVEADLIIDALGRNSRLSHWMKENNLIENEIPSSFANSHAVYVSQSFQNNFKHDYKQIADMPVLTKHNTLTVLLQHRQNEWLLCFGIYGVLNFPKKLTSEQFLELASEKFQREQFSQFLKESTPISEPNVYSNLTSFRRHFEQVKMPKNVVAIGDSVATFNPTYGQGMSYAAIGAEKLHNLLEEKILQLNIDEKKSNNHNNYVNGNNQAEQGFEIGNNKAKSKFSVGEIKKFDVSNEFFEQIKPATDFCWDVAVAPDWKLPLTEGDKPEQKNFLLGLYFDAVKEVARNDRVVQDAFLGAINMSGKSGRVLEKDVMFRVLAGIILQNIGIRK